MNDRAICQHSIAHGKQMTALSQNARNFLDAAPHETVSQLSGDFKDGQEHGII